MPLLLASLVLLLAGGTAALCLSSSLRWSTRIGAGSAVVAAALGLGGTVRWLGDPEGAQVRWPWHVPYGEFHLGIDPLSALFLLPLFVLAGLTAVYGAGYMRKGYGAHAGASWFFFNLLVASIALLFLARNGVLFLTAWELMALSSFFLVTWEHDRAEVRAAGWTYLLAAHLGTAFLLAFFALLGSKAGGLDFDQFGAGGALSSGLAGGLFILAVTGFGVKAGFVPLHVWLPEAHPAAPSHVSALMSGVMIKTGIYGILRTLTFLPAPPAWWGLTLVAIGLSSGVLGVLFALAQHDLKRLLAYHSVENIGIIALGLGVGVWGLSQGIPTMAILGFAGALLHVVNHALFKGLLFLVAGSVLHATGEREMDRLGGLLRRMPMTGTTFLIGAAAISGLPPLNGFISEFLIALGSLEGVVVSKVATVAAMSAVLVGLGLIGGLAVACFTKASGITFLGAPRTREAAGAHEGSAVLVAPMLVLAALCVLLGATGVLSVRLVLPATVQLTGVEPSLATEHLSRFAAPLGRVTILALLVLGLGAALAFLRLRLLSRRPVGESVTWDCGYERPTSRMQYTSSSFAQPITVLARRLLDSRVRLLEPRGYFPKQAAYESRTADPWSERLYGPLLRAIEWSGGHLRWVQQGRLAIYLLYIFATLLVVMVWRLGFA